MPRRRLCARWWERRHVTKGEEQKEEDRGEERLRETCSQKKGIQYGRTDFSIRFFS